MTGAIGRDARGARRLEAPDQQRTTSQRRTAVFSFWQRGSRRVKKVKCFLCYCCFCASPYRAPPIRTGSAGIRGGSSSPLLVQVLTDTKGFSSLLLHFSRIIAFFFNAPFLSLSRASFLPAPGIDQVTRQQWGSQFHLRSLSTPLI